MNEKPIVWSIGGSDCSSGAGCQADLLTCHDFGVHATTIVTAITAQNAEQVLEINYVDANLIDAQIKSLTKKIPPNAIKLGLLGTKAAIAVVGAYLKEYSGMIICDPVLNATSGKSLNEPDIVNTLKKIIFPQVDLLTPNIPEAEILTNKNIDSLEDMSMAAQELLNLGVAAVLLKGGHLINDKACDFFTDGKQEFWLIHSPFPRNNVRGTGCTLSSAISSALALDYSLADALVIAKMYIQQGIRESFKINGNTLMGRQGFPKKSIDLPWILKKPDFDRRPFLDCGKLGFYPIVDSVEWVRQLLSDGVRTIQLRIKNQSQTIIKKAILESVQLAQQYQAKLFINDYWKLAIEAGAYGVHLGQEDLETADIPAIHRAGLRLGISTHSFYELARAHAIQPSYIAFGPIYETYSKPMAFSPRGLSLLRHWCEVSPYPVVAIGGINLDRLKAVLNAGATNVAVISAVTQSPKEAIFSFLKAF